MKARGRPVLGAISGLLFGFFVAVDLQQFAVRPLDNVSFFGLPLVGLLLGIGLATWAPFGRKAATAAVPQASRPAQPQMSAPAQPPPPAAPPAPSPPPPPPAPPQGGPTS